MPGTILPLPVMLDEEDRKIYEKLEPPKSIVVRYGYMRMVAELPYDGDAKPGCGSKLVIRSQRGIELGEMLTTTCPNSGCGKSVSRKDMLDYIENSGGKNYPFSTQGKILRVATPEDMIEQQRLDAKRPEIIRLTKALIREIDLKMKLVDIELLLGGERIIFHYTSEDWVDFRELVKRLAAEYQTRIEMHQVNARDEARITADYEKCGQHCCCKQFLKVLKPVSMRSAKIQKATLDPTKISGRCGRLMCCLRYEDETYDDLRKRLPKRQTRWMTDDGPGTVLDTQILTQLVLIQLDRDGSSSAYPLENITAISKEEDEKFRAELEERQRSAREREERREERREMKQGGPRNEQRPEQRGEQQDRGQGSGERGQQSERGERQDRPPRDREQRGERPDRSQSPGERGQEQGGRRQEGGRRQDGGDRERQPDGQRGEGRREERPPRQDQPRRDDRRRDEPRRPQPGQPLGDDEIEAREGAPLEGGFGDEQLPPALEPADEGEFSDGDEPDGESGQGEDGAPMGDGGNDAPAQPGQPGQPGEGGRKRKRRRRRRRRGGGGPGGGPGGPGGPGGGPQGGPQGGPPAA